MDGIVLGQYIPGCSVLHRLDPRTKLVLSLVLVWFVFLIKSLPEFVAFGAFIFILYLAAGVSSSMFRVLKPGFYLVIFTLLMNILFFPGHVIVNLGILAVTREGVIQGLTVSSRLLFLISASSLVTLTTSPLSMTGGLEALLRPLKRIGIPVSELAMMMNIALKFIPTFLEETDKIMKAQAARGADFKSWHPGRRLKYLSALLVPLFISAFRRADELSVAIESRGYVVGMNRTSLHELKLETRDYVAMVLVGVVFCGFVAYRYFL